MVFCFSGPYSFDNANNIHGLVRDCSNAIANALELPKSCNKPSIYSSTTFYPHPFLLFTLYCHTHHMIYIVFILM